MYIKQKYRGLVRYDGKRFERVDRSMNISGVKSLYADGKDRLWIGMNDKGLAMMHRGEVIFWGMYKYAFITCDYFSCWAVCGGDI